MSSFGSELRIAAVAVPWLAAIAIAVGRRQARPIAFMAALVSAIAGVFLVRMAPASESLDEVVTTLYSALALGATLVIPRRDCTPVTMSGDDGRSSCPITTAGPARRGAGLFSRLASV